LISKDLRKADKIIVINRIKPHTDFKGEIESGLLKMMVIGMGKHQGSLMVHRLTIKHGFPAVLAEVGSILRKKLPIFFGVGIIENQYDQTALIELVKTEEFVEKEKVLLKRARELMPSLPFNEMDILIVDEMGKDISGTGMDTNVVGRNQLFGNPKFENPKITRIFVRDLTEGSHGNATGIGMADYTTKRLVDKIDYYSTHINCINGMTPENARVPVFFEKDREALHIAHYNSGVFNPKDLRILWIKNTLELEYVFASQAFLDETQLSPRLEILSEPFAFPFDDSGNLIPQWS